MELYLMLVIFISGIIFGSFYNVCIYRIPNKLSIIRPPSHCYNCNTKLKPKDLVPILSWISIKGKCRYCKIKVSPRYALVELLTGIVFLLIYLTFGYNTELIYYLVLVSLLMIITFIDIDHYIIPDEVIIIGSLFAVIFNIIHPMIGIKESLTGGLVCGLLPLTIISIIEFITKKEVMGGGDIKLFSMLGLFLGIRLGGFIILLSVYVGAIYSVGSIIYSKIREIDYSSIIPYGPFISIAAIMVTIYGENIINWYWKLFI